MDQDSALVRTRSIGRLVLWLVLAILAGAALYTLSIALQNWGAIGAAV